MKQALFAGTFDPPSLAHLDIIERAARLCGKLYIGLAKTSNKRSLFPIKKRIQLLELMLISKKNIEIIPFSGLAVNCAKSIQADVLIRGLRNTYDFNEEYQMAACNKAISGIETLFLMSNPQYCHISASLIREIGTNGGRLHPFVPALIEEEIFNHLSKTI